MTTASVSDDCRSVRSPDNRGCGELIGRPNRRHGGARRRFRWTSRAEQPFGRQGDKYVGDLDAEADVGINHPRLDTMIHDAVASHTSHWISWIRRLASSELRELREDGDSSHDEVVVLIDGREPLALLGRWRRTITDE